MLRSRLLSTRWTSACSVRPCLTVELSLPGSRADRLPLARSQQRRQELRRADLLPGPPRPGHDRHRRDQRVRPRSRRTQFRPARASWLTFSLPRSNAALKVTKIVVPGMVSRKRGLILNVGSFASLIPSPLLAVYSGSKAFLSTWSQALGSELKGTGVEVELLNTYFVVRRASLRRRRAVRDERADLPSSPARRSRSSARSAAARG